MRFLKRYEKGVEKVLFSVSTDEQEVSLSELTSNFIDLLQKKLRKSDVVVQIKSDQILIFLPIITKEEGDMVIQRITSAFNEMSTKQVCLKYVSEHVSFE